MFTKKLLFLMLLCIGFVSCSSDDDDPQTNNPITNLEIPQSSSDNPIKAGKSVTIKGEGFTQTSEIWFKVITKSTENQDVKAEVTSVNVSGISFRVPDVSGERSIILKQSGQEYTLGKMYFDDSSETIVKKRLVKRDFSFNSSDDEIFEYSYNEGKLAVLLEKMSDGDIYQYNFVYDNDGRLASVHETNYNTKKKVSDKVFEYKDALTILAHETYYDDEDDNETVTLTLNEKGFLAKKKSPSTDIENEYDNFGNIVKSNEDGIYKYTYAYDDKYSYLSNQGLPVWYWAYDSNENFNLYTGQNNMITSTFNGNPDDSYRFDYDEDGYPTAVYDKNNGDKKVGEFIYEIIK